MATPKPADPPAPEGRDLSFAQGVAYAESHRRGSTTLARGEKTTHVEVRLLKEGKPVRPAKLGLDAFEPYFVDDEKGEPYAPALAVSLAQDLQDALTERYPSPPPSHDA